MRVAAPPFLFPLLSGHCRPRPPREEGEAGVGADSLSIYVQGCSEVRRWRVSSLFEVVVAASLVERTLRYMIYATTVTYCT